MREDDQRRLARAALLHDVGKAFIPVTILDKPGALTPEEMEEMRQHPRRGYDALSAQGGFPPEMLDVVLHHHEFLDGTGYPNGLSGKQISDIVRVTTIMDIYAALVEKRAYRLQFTHAKAFLDDGRDGRANSTSICCRRSARWRSGIDDRHSGMVRRTRPGISRFSDVQLHIIARIFDAPRNDCASVPSLTSNSQTAPPHTPHRRRPWSVPT